MVIPWIPSGVSLSNERSGRSASEVCFRHHESHPIRQAPNSSQNIRRCDRPCKDQRESLGLGAYRGERPVSMTFDGSRSLPAEFFPDEAGAFFPGEEHCPEGGAHAGGAIDGGDGEADDE